MSDAAPFAVEMGVAAEARSVAEVRDAVIRVARRAPWMDAGRIEDLRLLVSEVVTNAVAAHGSRQESMPIDIRCEATAESFELTVRDHGGGFDAPTGPMPLPEPDPDRVSGFGLGLIWTLADEVRFTRTADGTEVRIIFVRRDLPPVAPDASQPAS